MCVSQVDCRDEVEIQIVFAKKLTPADWKFFQMKHHVRRRLWPLSECEDSVFVPLKDRSGNTWRLQWKRQASRKGWWLGGQTGKSAVACTVSGL